MILKRVDIRAFGCFQNRSFLFERGLNLLEGDNESGKSTLCAFLKFVFYGLSKNASKGELSELSHYMPWEGDFAGGSLTLEKDGIEYRIEREICLSGRSGAKSSARRSVSEQVRIFEASTGTPVEADPAAFFLQVPEDVFFRSAFVSQRGIRAGGRELLESIENLLFSADEATNTQKALKRLDDARIQLLYKNEKGGKIYDLRCEAQSLEERLAEAKYQAHQMDELEEKYRAQTKVYETNREKLEETAKQLKITEAIRRFRQIEASKEAQTTYFDALARERDFLTASSFGDPPFLPDDNYRGLLTRLESEYHYTEKEYAVCLSEEASIAGSLPSEEDSPPTDGDALLQNLEQERQKAKTLSIFGGILLALAALAAGFGVLGLLSQVFAAVGVGCFGTAFVLGALGVSFLAWAGKRRRRQKAILAERQVEDLAHLERVLQEEEADYRKRMRLRAKLEACTERKRICEERLSEIQKKIGDLARRWGHTCESLEDLTKLIAALDAFFAKKAQLLSQKETAKAGADALRVSTTEEEVQTLRQLLEKGGEELVGDAYDECRKKNRFYRQTTELMREKLLQMENRRTELRLSVESPAELSGRLRAVQEEERRLKQLHDAYALAYEKLQQASDSLRERIAPTLSETASALMGQASEGRYEKLLVDETLTLRFLSEGATREAGYFSGGTGELAYLCLRLALVKLLYGDNRPPLIFDESFAALDDRRMAALLRALGRAFTEGKAPTDQVILLTSQTRERQILSENFGDVGFVCTRM